MEFITSDYTARLLANTRHLLPPKIDLVVGVPRSGLIPATMLATMLNVPMTDPDGLMTGRLFGCGTTKRPPDFDGAMGDDRTVVVIDDAVESGAAFRDVRDRLTQAGVKGRIITVAAYAPVRRHPDVDLVLKVVPISPMFQWNLMHHRIVETSCVDIDGVLCSNPQAHQDDGGAAYIDFLRNAPPLLSTSRKIGALVTSRRGKFRSETEAWLRRNGIAYGTLIMAETDADVSDSPRFKADVYCQMDADLFIESESADAQRIANVAQRPVLCIADQAMVTPSGVGTFPARFKPVKTRRHAFVAKAKLKARQAIGDDIYYAVKSIVRQA